jgi:hypothetical protein
MLGEVIMDIEVLIIEKKEKENPFIQVDNLNYRLPGAVDWTPEDGEWKPEDGGCGNRRMETGNQHNYT